MRKTPRRRVLAVAGTGLASTLAGCASVMGNIEESQTTTDRPSTRTTTPGGSEPTTESTTDDQTTQTTEQLDVEISEPDVFSASIPTPSNPSNYEYAVMGDPADAPTVTVYGNWKCPYTQEFVRETLPGLVEEFVAAGDVAVEYRTVAYVNDQPFLGPDAPRAARAGLAAWNVDPESFWQYFAYVFGNQPSEEKAWAQPDVLARFATQADIDSATAFQEGFTGSTYSQPVHATSGRFAELGGEAVPRVVTSSGMTAPTVDPEATREQFRRLAETGGN